MKRTENNFSDATRQHWLRLMALAPVAALEAATDLLAAHQFTFLAPPEIGLAMVRGRPGGSAAAFNLGEMTLTRCVVATTDRGNGARLIGHGHVAGRDRRHAELIARFDAVFQDSATEVAARDRMLGDLAGQQQAAHAESAAATAATKVDFFTLVRGE